MTHARRLLTMTAVVSAFAMVAPAPISADVLLSNLAEPFRDASPIGNFGVLPPPPVGDWGWAAQSFAPDANAYDLLSFDALVGQGSTQPAPTVVAGLHADSGGSVGALITTLTAPVMGGPLSVRTFVPDNPVTLLANTTYWFVLGSEAPGSGTYFWGYAQGNGVVGPGSLLNFNYSYDSGATWQNFGSDNPFFLQVNVRGVPEPAGLALAGIVIAVASRLRRRRLGTR